MLGLEVEQNIFEHLNQTEKYPDPTFIDSLMKIQNTENVVLGRENDPLESVAETYFSNPATYEESIGELVLELVFGEKYYCIYF